MKKTIVGALLCALFLMETVFAQQIVPILMYHNLNHTYPQEKANVEMRPDEFSEQLSAMLQAGYTPITLYQYKAWADGEESLPEKPFIVTFDDGYLNNYTYAYPIAKSLGVPITIFIITDRMGMADGVAYPHFTWEQAREMEESGYVDIESHTNCHSDLFLADRKTTVAELRMSKYLIWKHLQKDARFLAYPYGNYTEYAIEQAQKAGYDGCVIIKQQNPDVNRKGDSLYTLKRITACGGMKGKDLIAVIESLKDR